MKDVLDIILKTTQTDGRSISFKQENNLIRIKIRQANGEFVNQVEKFIDSNKFNGDFLSKVILHTIGEMNRSMDKKILA